MAGPCEQRQQLLQYLYARASQEELDTHGDYLQAGRATGSAPPYPGWDPLCRTVRSHMQAESISKGWIGHLSLVSQQGVRIW